MCLLHKTFSFRIDAPNYEGETDFRPCFSSPVYPMKNSHLSLFTVVRATALVKITVPVGTNESSYASFNWGKQDQNG